MKTVFFAALAAGGLLACASAFAQESTNKPASAWSTNAPPHRAIRGPDIDRLAQILDLTADQKAKVQPIMDEQWQKIHDLFQQVRAGTIAPGQRMAKINEIRNATDAQMKSVLTAEQYQKWQGLSQPRPRMMRPMPPVSAPTNGAAPRAP